MIGNTFFNGQTNVTTAGTRVQVTTEDYATSTIKAKATNSGNIYVGDVTVAAANGFILAAGEEVTILINSSRASIYIDSAINGEGVSYIAWGKIG